MLALSAIILAIVMLASVWQHFFYLRKRRTSAQDLQRLLHSGATFHILIFFRIRGGEKIVETAARFKQQVMSSGKARLVYAGQAAFSIKSAQLGKRDWDGVLLFEYPLASTMKRVLPILRPARLGSCLPIVIFTECDETAGPTWASPSFYCNVA